MKMKRVILFLIAAVALCAALVIVSVTGDIQNADYGFAREVSTEEEQLRLKIVTTAESWLGCKESDGSHKPIIDIYNAHEPLAEDYTVKYTDQWCATFGSTVAIQCEMTGIIPTECGCQRQIELFRKIGCWEENDGYIPLPGDYIFFSLGNAEKGDCTAWSDHVGIVVGTWKNYIKVIEGNNDRAVKYRYIQIDDAEIRGFGLPDYETFSSEQ